MQGVDCEAIVAETPEGVIFLGGLEIVYFHLFLSLLEIGLAFGFYVYLCVELYSFLLFWLGLLLFMLQFFEYGSVNLIRGNVLRKSSD